MRLSLVYLSTLLFFSPLALAQKTSVALCPFDYIFHRHAHDETIQDKNAPYERIDRHQLLFSIRSRQNNQRSLVLRADHVTYQAHHTWLSGHIAVLHNYFEIHTEHASYEQKTHILKSDTPTTLLTHNLAIQAQSITLNTENKQSQLSGISYQINNKKKYAHDVQQFIGSGKGERITFDGDHYVIYHATYSTCPTTQPFWFISADQISISPDDQDLTIKGARFHLKNTTLLYLPLFHFPLHNTRTSGFLTPLYAENKKTGFSFAVPYYFNLSENYDFTFTPYYMDKTGLSLQGHFRWMDQYNHFSLKTEYLTIEKKRDLPRYAIDFKSFQTITPHWHIKTRISHVSDDHYFTDIISQIGGVNTILLPTYFDSRWDFEQATGYDRYQLYIQKYQLAYSPTSEYPAIKNIPVPYSILPSFKAEYLRYGRFPIPWELTLTTQLTQFEDAQKHRWSAWRAHLQPGIKTHWSVAHLYITPSIGANSTQDFITLHGPHNLPVYDHSPSITTPYFSTDIQSDIGLTWQHKQDIIAIKPHIFYLFIPKNIKDMPIFDTAPLLPHFSSIYTNHLLSGPDQQANAHQITTGIDFSLWDTRQQNLLFSGHLAQRYYWADSYARLPLNPFAQSDTPFDPHPLTLINKKGTSDTLLELETHIRNHFMLSTYFQLGNGRDNPHHGLYRFHALASYIGDSQHIVSTGLYYQRKGITQLGLSGIFPITHQLFGIAAIHYAIQDQTLYPHHAHFFSNSILGLQYINCCIATTLIFTYTRSPISLPIRTIFLRFTIGGLGQIGQNKTGLLEYEIPGYHDFLSDPHFRSTH